MLPGVQPLHLILILIIALVIFGPSRLPEIGRGLGKAINEFRAASNEMTRSLTDEIDRGDKREKTEAEKTS